jgi:hypothetical protein
MSPLNIHPEEYVGSPKKKNNKMLKVMLGIGALVLVPVIGTTFASLITVNNNEANVTFGQGQQAAIACDSDVTLTPEARYYQGNYVLKKVTITSGTNLANCVGKQIQISAADTTGLASVEIGLVTVGAGDPPIAAKATLTGGSEGCNADLFTCTWTPASGGNPASLVIDVVAASSIDATLIGNFLIQQTN